MPPLIYTSSNSENELAGIIELQRNNIPANLTQQEMESQGFVTVIHDLADLEKMNKIEQHIICKDGEKVIAYLLAMTSKSKNDIPVLLPMFEIFKSVLFKGRPVSAYNYLVVGQVCIDKNYRGQGVLDMCYYTYKNSFKKRYDFAITEIDCRNLRSINAHRRIGFSQVHRYTSPDKKEWSVVIWDWES